MYFTLCCLYGNVYTVAFARQGGFCGASIGTASNDVLPSIGRSQSPPGPIASPVSTFLFLYQTSHSFSLNITLQPPLHNFLIDTNDEWLRPGTICHFRDSFGRPGILR